MPNIDWNLVLIELVRILPNICGIILLITIGLIFRNQLRGLFNRLSRFGAFGFEIEFGENAKVQLARAITSYADAGTVDKAKVEATVKRAERLQDRLRGARILWLDDHPLANANIHRFLNDFGVNIDHAQDTTEALYALTWTASAYEVIVSDMNRNGNGRAGLDFIAGLQAKGISTPVILFVAKNIPEMGTPAGARVITDQVDELINHIFDVIDQKRTVGED